jgi:hypothetical protein
MARIPTELLIVIVLACAIGIGAELAFGDLRNGSCKCVERTK